MFSIFIIDNQLILHVPCVFISDINEEVVSGQKINFNSLLLYYILVKNYLFYMFLFLYIYVLVLACFIWLFGKCSILEGFRFGLLEFYYTLLLSPLLLLSLLLFLSLLLLSIALYMLLYMLLSSRGHLG